MQEMLRYNTGKARLSFLPSSFWAALMDFRGENFSWTMVADICKVLDFGAAKYAKDNWRTSGSWCKVADSGLRHLLAYIQGETHDQESGLPHLSHFGCNLVFLIEYQTCRSGLDDRYKRPEGQQLVPFDENEPSEIIMLQLLSRWLENEDDEYLMHCLGLLSDMYGEVGDEPPATVH